MTPDEHTKLARLILAAEVERRLERERREKEIPVKKERGKRDRRKTVRIKA